MTKQCLESWSTELQRFKELSLQKCNSEAKSRASSQNLHGALVQLFSFRGRGLTWIPKTGGPLEVSGIDIPPCTVLLSLKEVVDLSSCGRDHWEGPQT